MLGSSVPSSGPTWSAAPGPTTSVTSTRPEPTRRPPPTPTPKRLRTSRWRTGARSSSCSTRSLPSERLPWLDVNADVAADLKDLAATLAGIEAALDIDRLRAQVAELQEQASRPDLWDDVEHAQQVNSKLAHKQGDLRR